MKSEMVKIGTVNGFILSFVWVGNVKVTYNGTTLGLVLVMLKRGYKVGQKFRDEQGRTRCIKVTGGGDRTPNGEWATEWNLDY